MTKEEKSLYNKMYQLKNREKLLKQKLNWYYNNKERSRECARRTNRKKWYGLEHEDYLQLLKDQNYVCAICGLEETVKNPSGHVKPLSVDHCHTTNKIRGLLCTSCNVALGYLKDDVTLLAKAIVYLERNW